MQLFYNNKGKVCGFLKDAVYFKEVNSKRHLMKIYNAYAISEDIVDKLKIAGCFRIRLREKDTKRIYEVNFITFIENAFVKDWDGKQYFLPLKHWRIEDATIKLF